MRDRLSVVEVLVAVRWVEQQLRSRDCGQSEEEARDRQGCDHRKRKYRSMSHGRLPRQKIVTHMVITPDSVGRMPATRIMRSRRAGTRHHSKRSLPLHLAFPSKKTRDGCF